MNWYEHHGYAEDPFKVSDGPIDKAVNLNKPTSELLYNVEAGNMVVIEGGKGTGKTTLLSAVIEHFRGERKVVYFDCSKDDVDIKKLMQGKYGVIGRLFNLTPKGMVLLLDNFKGVSKKEMERAKFFYDNNYIRSIVFTGTASNLAENIADRVGERIIKLKALGVNDAVELVKNRLGTLDFLSAKIVKKLHKKSKSDTVLFLENCSKACAAATKAGDKLVKDSHLKGVNKSE